MAESHDWNRISSLYEVRVMGFLVIRTAPKLWFDLYLMCAPTPTGIVLLQAISFITCRHRWLLHSIAVLHLHLYEGEPILRCIPTCIYCQLSYTSASSRSPLNAYLLHLLRLTLQWFICVPTAHVQAFNDTTALNLSVRPLPSNVGDMIPRSILL